MPMSSRAYCLRGETIPWSESMCTRTLYVGDDGMVITGRNMDWKEDMASDLWVFPAGIGRDGAAGPNSIRWTSQYGSVAVSAYDSGTADGLNEKGLAANLLYLAESDHGTPDGQRPLLSNGVWLQYVVDNYATVAEALTALGEESFQMLAPSLPNGAKATLHLSISDFTGDSAIHGSLSIATGHRPALTPDR